MASITIKYFASLREALGMSEQLVDIAVPASVKTVLEQVAKESTSFAEYFQQSPVLVAVNQAIVSMDFNVNDGDELAVFPPVTGG